MEHVRNLREAPATEPCCDNGIVVNIHPLATNRQTLQFPSSDSGPHSFFDKVGLKFSDGRNQGNEQPPNSSIGCDVLPPRDELDAERVQFINDTEEVLGRTCHAVKGSDDENIKRTLSAIAEHGVEAGTPSLGTTYTYIGEFSDDLKATLSSELPEVIKLIVHTLVWRGYSCINRTLLHAKSS
jgi:hypothetical protein